MKKLSVFLAAGLVILPLSGYGAQTAQATAFCWSLRFQQGRSTIPFSTATLDLSTISGAPNGELAPWYFSYTHTTKFVLDFNAFPITGTLHLNMPPDPDANGNGFDDSFEVSQGVSGVSSGEFTYPGGHGTITATWTRAAGSKAGNCLLHLVDDDVGDIGTYRHAFEVLEYKGPLTYTAGSNTVSGIVNLTNATDQLLGRFNFSKSTNDPQNELTLQSAFLTNVAQQTFDLYQSTTFYRDQSLVTNYFGAVEFNDGDPNTVLEDYYSWELSIDDLNDSDHDGIPDFSDNPASAVLARQPLLSVARGLTNVLITIHGDVGHLHRIQEAGSVTSTNWPTVLSVTLTNDPQVVTLPLPASGMSFWRAQAQ